MAEKVLSIKDAVNEINNNTKHFGTKMPSNGNLEKEMDEQGLTYSQMIMGSLASLVWGKLSVTTDKKAKSLLSSPNNIYNIINSIKDNIETIKTSVTTNGINVNIKNVKDITTNINEVTEAINTLSNKIPDKFKDIISKDSTKENQKIELIINGDTSNIKDALVELNKFDYESFMDMEDIFISLNKNLEAYQTYFDNIINKLDPIFKTLKDYNDNVVSVAVEYKFDEEELQKSIDKVKSKINTFLTYDESVLNNIITDINSKLNSININIDDAIADNITKLIESLQINENDLKQTQLAIDSLESILNSLEYATSYDPIKINNNLKELIELFNHNSDVSDNFSKLFENISNILNNDQIKEISKDITGLNSVLQTIITVISLDPKSINLKGLKTLLRITDINNGLITKLLNNLKTLATGDNNARIDNKNFIAIKDFFEAISEIGNIGLFKRALIKSNIKYFINFIGEEIPKLLEKISKSANKTISNENVKSIIALQSIFESLSKIGEINFKHKIRMKLNLMYIRNFIIKDVVNILNEIIESITDATKESSQTIDSFIKLLDKIFDIGKISFTKFILLSLKLDLLEDIIEDQVIGDKDGGILGLIISIKKDTLKKSNDNLEQLSYIFDSFHDIIDDQLSLKEIMLFSIKVSNILSSIFKTKLIIATLSKIDGRTVNAIIIKLDKLTNLFEKTKTIVELISSIKTNLKNVYKLLLVVKKENEIIEETKNLINILNSIDYDDDKTKKILDVIKTLSEIKSNIVLTKLYQNTLKVILGSVDIIKDICKKIKDDIKKDDIENAKEVLGSFNAFIFKSAAILLLGSIIMGAIKWENLLAFTIALSGFLFVLSKTFKNIAESLKEDIKTADEVIKLIAASGLILLTGSYIMNIIDPNNLKTFTITLGGFLLALSLVFSIIAESLKEDIKIVDDIIKLVAATGFILLLGSYITKLIEPQNLIIFTVTLGVFLRGITYILNELNKDIKESIQVLKDAIIVVGMASAILVLGSLAASQIEWDAIGKFLGGLTLLLFGITYIFNAIAKNLKDSTKTAKEAIMVIGLASTILIVGSLAATQFDLEAIGKFLGGLAILLVGVWFLFKQYGKKALRGTYDGAKQALKVVAMASAILIVGSLAATQFDLEAIGKFLGGLAILLVGVWGLFKLYGKKALRGTYDGAKQALKVVAMASAILIVGSLAATQFNWENLTTFLVGLTVFLGGIYLLFSLYNGRKLNKSFKSAKKALLIVGAATLILIAGSLASNYYSFEKAIGFIIELGSFLIALGILFLGIGILFKNGIKRVRKLISIVIASSIIMVMAQLLYDYLDTEKIFGFVLILGGFMIALAAAFWVAGQLMKKAFFGMALMLLVTVTAGLILLFAGKIVSDNPGILTNAFLFGVTIAGYVAIMGLVCGLLGDCGGDVALGALVMAGIMVVTLLAIGVMYIMYKVASQSKFFVTILKGLGAMGAVFGSFIAVIIGLGMAVSGPQAALLAAGAAALGVIEGLVWGAAKVLSAIAISVKQLQSVNVSKDGFKQMGEIIKGFAGLTLLLIDEFPSNLKLAKLLFIIPAVKKMSEAVGSMAKGIKEFADLKIPTNFDESGNATDWTTIAKEDFKTAQTNIGNTLTCIVDAILSVAKTHSDLFKPSIIMDSPAMNAAKVAKKMGEAIGSIAVGIKEMADLKIVSKYDSKGNPKEWISLGEEDFNKVSVNLAVVLTCINNALLDVAKQYPKLFDDHLFKDSPAMNAAKVAKKMGEAIGSIAVGIKEMADLKIVSKYDSHGNAKEWISIGDDPEIFKKVKTNIENVLTCINDALLKVAKEKPELFDDSLFSDSPAMNAAKVAKKMGEAIGSIATGIKDWADLKIATKFDSQGNAIEYKSLVDDDFDTAKKNITAVLTCIGQALVTTVKGNTELFDDGMTGDSPAMQAAKAMAYMGTTLAITATAVAAYSKGQIPTYDKDGNLLPDGQWIKMNLKDMSNGKNSKTYKAIETVLTCLGSALVSIVKNPKNKEIFDTGFFGGDSPAMQAAKSVQLIGETLTSMIKVITDLSNIKTEDLSGKIDIIRNNIDKSLTSIMSIFDLFTSGNKKEQEAVKGGFKGFINNVVKVVNSESDGIFKTNGSIAEYINNHIKDVKEAGDAIEDFKDVLNSLINSLASLSESYKKNEELLKLYDIKNVKGKTINSPLINIFSNALTTIKSLYDTIITSFEKSSINVELLSKKNEELINIINLYNAELDTYSNLINKVKIISNDINNDSKLIINTYRSEFVTIKTIYNLLIKSFKDIKIDELAKQHIKIISIINCYYGILIQFDNLISKINNQNIIDQGPLIISSFVSSMNVIKYLYNSIISSENLSIDEYYNKIKELNEIINFYIGTLDKFISLGHKAEEYGADGYNVLRDGIIKIYLATGSILTTNNFKNHVRDLEKYIQTINSVELGKLSMMKGFVDAMNQLSMRLGSLDNLTEAIANKLSAVLYELVNQLTKADASINNAHQLQEKRKKLIEESVSKIENLMSQHMIVEVSQVTQNDSENNNTSYSQGNINNKEVDGNTSGGTEYDKSTSDKRLGSPEETDVQKQKQQNMPNVLTREEFDNAMRDTWVKAIAKAVKK